MTKVDISSECDNCGSLDDIVYYNKENGGNLCRDCQKELRATKKLRKLREEQE